MTTAKDNKPRTAKKGSRVCPECKGAGAITESFRGGVSMTTPWEVRPVSEMPAARRGPNAKAGLTAAIRMLGPNDALFIACQDGQSTMDLQVTVSATARHVGARSRVDHERNGVWIYKNGME